MAVTTTPKTSWLARQLAADFPQFNFELAEICAWSPSTATVFYTPDALEQLLHELSHALLGHTSYKRDIELIAIERDAWHHAKSKLAESYGVDISADHIDDALDTYRQWLHDRSSCPTCSSTGVQTDTQTYHCLFCQTDWQVNDARTCGLKRYKIN